MRACHQSDTEEEAFDRIKDALAFTMNAMEELGEQIPDSDSEHSRRVVREVELDV